MGVDGQVSAEKSSSQCDITRYRDILDRLILTNERSLEPVLNKLFPPLLEDIIKHNCVLDDQKNAGVETESKLLFDILNHAMCRFRAAESLSMNIANILKVCDNKDLDWKTQGGGLVRNTLPIVLSVAFRKLEMVVDDSVVLNILRPAIQHLMVSFDRLRHIGAAPTAFYVFAMILDLADKRPQLGIKALIEEELCSLDQRAEYAFENERALYTEAPRLESVRALGSFIDTLVEGIALSSWLASVDVKKLAPSAINQKGVSGWIAQLKKQFVDGEFQTALQSSILKWLTDHRLNVNGQAHFTRQKGYNLPLHVVYMPLFVAKHTTCPTENDAAYVLRLITPIVNFANPILLSRLIQLLSLTPVFDQKLCRATGLPFKRRCFGSNPPPNPIGMYPPSVYDDALKLLKNAVKQLRPSLITWSLMAASTSVCLERLSHPEDAYAEKKLSLLLTLVNHARRLNTYQPIKPLGWDSEAGVWRTLGVVTLNSLQQTGFKFLSSPLGFSLDGFSKWVSICSVVEASLELTGGACSLNVLKFIVHVFFHLVDMLNSDYANTKHDLSNRKIPELVERSAYNVGESDYSSSSELYKNFFRPDESFEEKIAKGVQSLVLLRSSLERLYNAGSLEKEKTLGWLVNQQKHPFRFAVSVVQYQFVALAFAFRECTRSPLPSLIALVFSTHPDRVVSCLASKLLLSIKKNPPQREAVILGIWQYFFEGHPVTALPSNTGAPLLSDENFYVQSLDDSEPTLFPAVTFSNVISYEKLLRCMEFAFSCTTALEAQTTFVSDEDSQKSVTLSPQLCALMALRITEILCYYRQWTVKGRQSSICLRSNAFLMVLQAFFSTAAERKPYDLAKGKLYADVVLTNRYKWYIRSALWKAEDKKCQLVDPGSTSSLICVETVSSSAENNATKTLWNNSLQPTLEVVISVLTVLSSEADKHWELRKAVESDIVEAIATLPARQPGITDGYICERMFAVQHLLSSADAKRMTEYRNAALSRIKDLILANKCHKLSPFCASFFSKALQIVLGESRKAFKNFPKLECEQTITMLMQTLQTFLQNAAKDRLGNTKSDDAACAILAEKEMWCLLAYFVSYAQHVAGNVGNPASESSSPPVTDFLHQLFHWFVNLSGEASIALLEGRPQQFLFMGFFFTTLVLCTDIHSDQKAQGQFAGSERFVSWLTDCCCKKQNIFGSSCFLAFPDCSSESLVLSPGSTRVFPSKSLEDNKRLVSNCYCVWFYQLLSQIKLMKSESSILRLSLIQDAFIRNIVNPSRAVAFSAWRGILHVFRLAERIKATPDLLNMVQQNAARVIKIVETSKQQHLSSHSKETKLQKAVCSTEKLSRLRISLLTQYVEAAKDIKCPPLIFPWLNAGLAAVNIHNGSVELKHFLDDFCDFSFFSNSKTALEVYYPLPVETIVIFLYSSSENVRQNTQTLCRSIFGFDTVEECIRSARAKQSKAQDICADRIEFSVAKALDACLQFLELQPLSGIAELSIQALTHILSFPLDWKTVLRPVFQRLWEQTAYALDATESEQPDQTSDQPDQTSADDTYSERVLKLACRLQQTTADLCNFCQPIAAAGVPLQAWEDAEDVLRTTLNVLQPLCERYATRQQVRLLCLWTIKSSVCISGKLIQPFLPELLPALIRNLSSLGPIEISNLPVPSPTSMIREITSTRVSMTKKRTFLDISFGFLLGSLIPFCTLATLRQAVPALEAILVQDGLVCEKVNVMKFLVAFEPGTIKNAVEIDTSIADILFQAAAPLFATDSEPLQNQVTKFFKFLTRCASDLVFIKVISETMMSSCYNLSAFKEYSQIHSCRRLVGTSLLELLEVRQTAFPSLTTAINIPARSQTKNSSSGSRENVLSNYPSLCAFLPGLSFVLMQAPEDKSWRGLWEAFVRPLDPLKLSGNVYTHSVMNNIYWFLHSPFPTDRDIGGKAVIQLLRELVEPTLSTENKTLVLTHKCAQNNDKSGCDPDLAAEKNHNQPSALAASGCNACWWTALLRGLMSAITTYPTTSQVAPTLLKAALKALDVAIAVDYCASKLVECVLTAMQRASVSREVLLEQFRVLFLMRQSKKTLIRSNAMHFDSIFSPLSTSLLLRFLAKEMELRRVVTRPNSILPSNTKRTAEAWMTWAAFLNANMSRADPVSKPWGVHGFLMEWIDTEIIPLKTDIHVALYKSLAMLIRYYADHKVPQSWIDAETSCSTFEVCWSSILNRVAQRLDTVWQPLTKDQSTDYIALSFAIIRLHEAFLFAADFSFQKTQRPRHTAVQALTNCLLHKQYLQDTNFVSYIKKVTNTLLACSVLQKQCRPLLEQNVVYVTRIEAKLNSSKKPKQN